MAIAFVNKGTKAIVDPGTTLTASYTGAVAGNLIVTFGAVSRFSPAARATPHYLVQHVYFGVSNIVYEGPDSDAAYDAHIRMEREPNKYRGRHQFWDSGQLRVDREHTDIKS